MAKDRNNFKKANCDDCQCEVCKNACMNCCECYRAEYAKEEYEDFYFPYDSNSKQCHEF